MNLVVYKVAAALKADGSFVYPDRDDRYILFAPDVLTIGKTEGKDFKAVDKDAIFQSAYNSQVEFHKDLSTMNLFGE